MSRESYAYQRANYRQLTARVEDYARLRALADECGLTLVELVGILSHSDSDVVEMLRGMIHIKACAGG